MKALSNFFLERVVLFAFPMALMTLAAFLLVAWRFLLLNQSAQDERMDRFLPEFQSMP